MRTRTLVLLAIAVTVVPIWVLGLARGGGGPADGQAAAGYAPPPAPQVRALATLRRWDLARAEAWRRGDAVALARLYVRGSRTGRRDVGELARWRRRGLRVTRLRQQVASVRLVARTPGRLVLAVTDRTMGGVAVGHGRRLRLPPSPWSEDVVELRRLGRSWRVAEARRQPAR